MATTATTASAARRRVPWRQTASWIGLILLGAFNLYAALADLAAGAGLPSDHTGTFTAVTGRTWASFKDAQPGAAHYVTLVERGYALHELVFAALFLVIVTIPLRAGQRCCGVEHQGVGDLADLQGGALAGDGKGWQSLTPSERTVVDLVAEGLSNPDRPAPVRITPDRASPSRARVRQAARDFPAPSSPRRWPGTGGSEPGNGTGAPPAPNPGAVHARPPPTWRTCAAAAAGTPARPARSLSVDRPGTAPISVRPSLRSCWIAISASWPMPDRPVPPHAKSVLSTAAAPGVPACGTGQPAPVAAATWKEATR